jgi:hypothetical protein
VTTYFDVVYHCQVIKEADILKCTGDTQTGYRLGLLAAYGDGAIPVGKYNPACRRFLNTGNTIKKRRLSRAVRSDKTNDLTAVDVEADIFKGLQTPKAFVKLFYF